MDLSSYVVNCSIVYPGRTPAEAMAAAGAAGAGAVEFWWPFTSAAPEASEVDAFLAALVTQKLELAGMNLFAGDMPAGDRGVLSWPGREAEFASSVAVARTVQEATGCSVFNALYGRRQPDADPTVQDALALDNLAHAAGVLGELGGTVVLEAVSGMPDYPLKTAADVAAVLDAARERGTAHAGMLLDVYHLATNGDDVSAAIAAHIDRISHVQLADAPGRGLPGSGALPIPAWLDELRERGYRGRTALEFAPSTDDPFDTGTTTTGESA